MRNLEEAAGGREALVKLLEEGPKTGNLECALALLNDPTLSDKPIEEICRRAEVSLDVLIEQFKRVELARAHLDAVQRIASKLPEVAGDVMDRALEHTVPCKKCAGKGTVLSAKGEESVCRTCHGEGTVPQAPDHDVQKTALELGGLLQKGGGVNVNVNQSVHQQVGVVSFGSAMRKFQQESDAVLYGSARRESNESPQEREA